LPPFGLALGLRELAHGIAGHDQFPPIKSTHHINMDPTNTQAAV